MKDRDRLLKLCVYGLEARGLSKDQRYKDRLKKDLKEIDAQGEYEYFLNLHDKFKRENLTFAENQHNNSVDFLLFLTDQFDIEKPSEYVQGEFPDIDIDYIKEVRDDLKRNWAADKFGQEFICEIGTYGTSGIKGAILDMARVHSLPKGEIQPITVKMQDKDDEGHELEWDKALEMYPDFRDYCERNQEVAECAHLLLDRIRTSSVHAGGLIVSDRRIDGFVPLEVRKVDKDTPNGVICSAWTEGLNRQDLQPVGLIKFDLLVVNNLKQIAVACNLVKERHGVDKICALPGQWDFSDISYLNDSKCIEMANKADLKCIFQFDSEGIRKLVKRGGVSSFDDIAAYSALYRPGCLMCFYEESKIKTIDGSKTVKELKNWHDEIAYIDKDGKIAYTKKFAIWKSGKKKMLKIRTKSGKELLVSFDHRILAEGDKFKKAESLRLGEKIASIQN
jgi:DNA polymerase-3 subunit alpha